LANRICCVCRQSKPVDDLVRVARIDGKYVIDEKGNANGRGCRICPGCVEKAIKTRALNKSFKANIGNEIYETLAKYTSKEYTFK
jgi:predicted RNA-binding protein YlxR (DUF448 family)